jgi:hypothetical protein
MNNYWRVLGHSMLYVLGGLICGCVIAALLIGVWTAFESGFSFSDLAAGWAIGLFIGMFAVMLGFFPALLYGAPAYAGLLCLGYASYVTAAVIGALPGLGLLAFGSDWGGLFLGYGVPVALCTHFLAKRHLKRHGMGANNSFKPTPLRGAA